MMDQILKCYLAFNKKMLIGNNGTFKTKDIALESRVSGTITTSPSGGCYEDDKSGETEGGKAGLKVPDYSNLVVKKRFFYMNKYITRVQTARNYFNYRHFENTERTKYK